MPLTKVTSGVRTLGTGEVATANMAVDPTNASNLSSGSVPTAQLGNVDTAGLEDDIAILGFKVASNGSLAKYNLVDQTVDDFQSEAGIDTSASTNQTYDSSGKFYSGANVGSYSVTAFTSTGASTWTCPADTTEAEVLIVGGGGGGNNGYYAGGGGAGGVVHDTDYAVVAGTVYDLSVGAGGSAGGNNGSNTVWNVNAEGSGITMTANGGGHGHPGADDGGSGGGGGTATNSSGVSDQPSFTGATSYGYAGQFGGSDPGQGGGGAGGTPAVSSGKEGGPGGVGRLFSNFTGYGTTSGNAASSGSDGGYFAGGGGGGAWTGQNVDGGAGGTGGGGKGGGYGSASGRSAVAGMANTGGGGGGGGGDHAGGDIYGRAGGSGILLLRHRPLAYNNLTLISNSTTAESTPTKGDLVMTYTDGAGTNVINTDIKAYVSRDNGTTYTQGTLVDQGTTGGHTILSFHDLDISGQPSGTSMRYKIETLNQSSSKYANIQAVSLGWS